MRYEVHVAAHGGGEETRFELERDEPLAEGEPFAQFTMIYKVLSIRPDHGDFDALVEAQQVGGPGQFAPP
jgi:hypothetical protein